MHYRSCDVRILGPKVVRCVQFVCKKYSKCLCETCLIGWTVKAVQTETCRHSRLLSAHNDKGLKIKTLKLRLPLRMRNFGLLHVETTHWNANQSTQWSRLSLEQLRVISVSQKTPRISCDSLPVGPILSQMNPIHTLPSYCFKSSCAYEINVDGEKA
jgi:hypothetical protein